MKYKQLELKNQLCFPLYAASKEIIKRYKPLLDKLGLTYTQYITMMVLWEHHSMNVKQLGEYLFLDSGTLTPVLKKMEAFGLVKRTRSPEDERQVIVEITEEGIRLEEKAKDIPKLVSRAFDLTEDEAKVLYKTLYKILRESR